MRSFSTAMTQPYNPYQPPQPTPPTAQPPQPAYVMSGPQVVGRQLWLPLTGSLPPLCVKCGRPDGITWTERRVSWRPGWSYLLLMFGGWPGLIAIVVTTRSATVPMATCAPCGSRWNVARMLVLLSVVMPIALAMGFATAAAALDSEALGVAAGSSAVLLLVAVTVALARRHAVSVTASAIDGYSLTLSGLSPKVLQAVTNGMQGLAQQG